MSVINLFGLLLVSGNKALYEHEINRERIRYVQMKELLFIGWVVWYVLEWMFYLITHIHSKPFVSLEEEVTFHQDNLNYLSWRPKYAWVYYIGG